MLLSAKYHGLPLRRRIWGGGEGLNGNLAELSREIDRTSLTEVTDCAIQSMEGYCWDGDRLEKDYTRSNCQAPRQASRRHTTLERL